MRACDIRRRLRSFSSDDGGASAVEFAIVSVPFLAICAAILQLALQIWTVQNFEHSLRNATRSVLTGDFQQETAGETDTMKKLAMLRERMCRTGPSPMPTLFDCGGVKIEVATVGSFGSSAPAEPFDSSTKDWNEKFGTTYTCARPGAIVIVTAAVKIPTFLGAMGIDFRTFADGSHLLLATDVFRVEPYEASGAASCAS